MYTVSLSWTASGVCDCAVVEGCNVTVTTFVVRERLVMLLRVWRFRSTIPIDPIPPGVAIAQFRCGSTETREFAPVLMVTGPTIAGGDLVRSRIIPYGLFLIATKARPLMG